MKKESKIIFEYSGRRSGLTMDMMNLIYQSNRENKTIYTNSQFMYDALTERGIKSELIEQKGYPIIKADISNDLVNNKLLRCPIEQNINSLFWSYYDSYLNKQPETLKK